MHVDPRSVGAVVASVGLAFVVITVVVEVIAVMMPNAYCKLARSVANAPHTRASTSVILVVSYRCTNNCGAFRGFGAIADHGSYEAMRDKVLDESKRVFKPEFLNRSDDMIVFHQLERNDLVKIVDLEVVKVIERVRAKDIKVHLDTTALEFLIDKGYDPTYGARPMRRAVEKYLEDPLAEGFLRANIKQGDTLEVHAAGEQLAFKVTVAGAK